MKKHSRRFFLRAAGVAVGLPVLESLVPRAARAEDPTAIKRLLVLFWPNGSTMYQDWQLSGSGTNYTMGSAHASLVPLKSKISMFTNLDRLYGGSPAHSRGTAEFLTGSPITNNVTPEVAISIDQVIADQLNPSTPIRSLHLGPDPYPSGPPSDTSWPSGYNTYISWASATSPNPPHENPQVAFDQIYVPSGTDPAIAERRFQLKQSVLDHTLDQISDVNPRLGSDDAHKLDEYLTAVREVESGLQSTMTDPMGCGTATAPGASLSFAEHTKAMLDIAVLALQCDATRIVTYSMDYGFGNKDFTFLGAGSYRHHNLSHGGTAQERVDAHKAIVRWYMDQIAYVLGQMDGIDEGGASMLDNSVVYCGSDMGNPWAHSPANLPIFVAGGGAGALNPGRLLDGSGVSYDSVLLGVAHAMGAPVASFSGASTPFMGL